MPLVNVKFHGPRPDFHWPGPRLIIEIDGEQFHQFPDVDAGYQATWEAHGRRVRRFPARRVYSHPLELVALYHSNVALATP
jgi:very-short-patch-repair endonuclease